MRERVRGGGWRDRVISDRLTRDSALWLVVALALPRIVGPVITIGLRRVVGPAAAGIFDLAAVPYRFLDNFRNFGTGPALIYERIIDRHVVDTAWSLNMLFALVVTCLAQLLAAPIAGYYGHPHVETVFRLLSIGYLLASAGSVHAYLLLRETNYRARAIPSVGQVIVAGDLAVLFALWDFGISALVARELASVALGTVLLWAVFPYRPRVQFDIDIVWGLLRYGAWIGAGLTLLFLSQNVDIFVGGRIIPRAADMGFYTTSWSLAFSVAGAFTLVAGGLVFPALSRLQDDMDALRDRLLQAIQQFARLLLPAVVLLALVAPVIVVPLLGHRWVQYRDSFPVLSLLAIYAGNRTLLSIFFEGYKSIGKPWIVPLYNLVKLLVLVPVMVYAAHFGIIGLAWAYVPVQAVEIPLALLLAWRVLLVPPTAVARAIWRSLVATLVMVGVVGGVEILLLDSFHTRDAVTLTVCIAIAIAIYSSSLWILEQHRSAPFVDQ